MTLRTPLAHDWSGWWPEASHDLARRQTPEEWANAVFRSKVVWSKVPRYLEPA